MLGGIVAVGAILRFATLDLQSYWSDEAATVELVRRSFGGMLAAIPATERTPPAYYILAWLWGHVFGTREAGLRSLSALLGTLTILCAYAIAQGLIGERAGLIAAALTTVSPILIWYSQEARSYAMLTFLSVASVWLWLRAKETSAPREIVAWAAVSSVAIATHYFASFLVVFEAISLFRTQRSRCALASLATLAVVQIALIPLAIHQARDHQGGDYITATSLTNRIVQVPEKFLLGQHWTTSERNVLGLILGACAVGVLWLLTRHGALARRRMLPLAAIALAATALPLVLALIGLDFFAPRNLLAVWALALIIGSAGLTASPGWAAGTATVGLLAAFATMTIATNLDPRMQRADWRYAPRALGHPHWSRLITVGPGFEDGVLEIYLPSAQATHQTRLHTREIDLVGYRLPPRTPPPSIGHGFHLLTVIDHQDLSFVRYLAPRSTLVSTRQLPALLGGSRAVLIELAQHQAQGPG